MQFSKSQSQFLDGVQDALRRYDSQLKDINHKIWSNPELAYAEFDAHNNVCELFENLKSEGYSVTRKAYDLETALQIEYKYGTGGRVVTFNAEYDALPGIGHACGHNLIATSSIAAFISAYACLMVHPVPIMLDNPELMGMATILEGGYLANDKVKVTFTGKPAHAAAAPWEGINALDAVVSAYVNISMLRQQILPTQKIHGVITNGGDRPNIIPMSATVEYYIRSPTVKTLKPLTEKVVKCFEAAATATGCKVELDWGVSYADLKTNLPICENYVSIMRALGHHTLLDNSGQKSTLAGASTDMGNVSYAVPGFHGIFTIPTEGVNHTPQFTKGAGSEEGFKRALACAAGMAVVACQILVDDKFAEDVQRNFEGNRSNA
ncbi:hypothetical protein N7530_010562 [Penicillium desertorum]|uniref:Peptidase M20 domain-containing protein 2 n=1 Tax=Penicillium desertorum TaxID=1303715 RepID=A0A9W9WHN7_9EURO|nr:hypothetical protein N7530_010562 [Penicillium desertorum]